MNQKVNLLKIKCPCCNRHLDEIETFDSVSILRKCKSCKNNIVTNIVNGSVASNFIDAKANGFDILNRKTTGSKGANQKQSVFGRT